MALRKGDELEPWVPTRPAGRCAVFGCQAPKLVAEDGGWYRRWCAEHAALHDRDASGAIAVILSFPGGRRIKNEVAGLSSQLRARLVAERTLGPGPASVNGGAGNVVSDQRDGGHERSERESGGDDDRGPVAA